MPGDSGVAVEGVAPPVSPVRGLRTVLRIENKPPRRGAPGFAASCGAGGGVITGSTGAAELFDGVGGVFEVAISVRRAVSRRDEMMESRGPDSGDMPEAGSPDAVSLFGPTTATGSTDINVVEF